MITFHPCRLLFLQIKPVNFQQGFKAADFKKFQNRQRKRIRVFEDPLGELSSMAIQVDDNDGHTDVSSVALMDNLSTSDLMSWADVIIRRWTNRSSGEFVVPVMWDDNELTYHLPLEDGWRGKLKFV